MNAGDPGQAVDLYGEMVEAALAITDRHRAILDTQGYTNSAHDVADNLVGTLCCRFHGGIFSPHPNGFECFLTSDHGWHRRCADDLVAWPLHEPRRMATRLGVTTVLGLMAAVGAEEADTEPLAVFSNAVAWLASYRQGICVIDWGGVRRCRRETGNTGCRPG